jgi:hypothetical protein
MQLTLGRGNNRQTFDLPTGRDYHQLKKQDGREAAKITGNIMGIVRRNSNKNTP